MSDISKWDTSSLDHKACLIVTFYGLIAYDGIFNWSLHYFYIKNTSNIKYVLEADI